MTDEATTDVQDTPVDAPEAPIDDTQDVAVDTTPEPNDGTIKRLRTAPDDNQIRRLRDEASKWRTQLRAQEERVKALEREKMNETERAIAERDEAVSRAKALEERVRVETLAAETLSAASTLNLVDGNDAVRLLDADMIEYDDTGKPTNLRALLTTLVEAKPYLIRQTGPNRPSAGDTPGRGGQVPAKPKETLHEKRTRLRNGGRPGGGDVFDPANAVQNGGGVWMGGKNLLTDYPESS